MTRALLAILLILPAAAWSASATCTTSPCDCSSLGVGAGETLTIDGKTWNGLIIRNCVGSSGNRINIVNDATDSSPVLVRRTSSGYPFSLQNIAHVNIDGTGGWVGMPVGAYCGPPAGTTGCGFVIEALSFSHTGALAVQGSAAGPRMRDFTLRGVEIDGSTAYASGSGSRTGIFFNDHSICASDNPGEWRENIIIEDNYIHDVYGEGMYFGPNWYSSQNDGDCPNGADGVSNNFDDGKDNVRLRDVTIRDNLLDDIGWEGINLKSCIEGDCIVQGNHVYDAGKRGDDPGSGTGIGFWEGQGSAIGNLVVRSGETGITIGNNYLALEPSPPAGMVYQVYNNVVIDSGVGLPLAGNGINARTDEPGLYDVDIYNNTVYGSENKGITVESSNTGAVVRHNISVNNDNTDVDNQSASPTTSNNFTQDACSGCTTGTIASLDFVNADALDFRLDPDSTAIDTATANYPATDFAGTARPQGANADAGAYEYNSGSPPPDPPATPSSGQYAPRGFVR